MNPPFKPIEVGAIVLLASEGLGEKRNLSDEELPKTDPNVVSAAEMFWVQVWLRVKYCDDHPSKHELLTLTERWGIPHWMGKYVAERMAADHGHRQKTSWLGRREKLNRAYALALEVAEEHEKGGTRKDAEAAIAERHGIPVSTFRRDLTRGKAAWRRAVSDPQESWPTLRNLPYIRKGGQER